MAAEIKDLAQVNADLQEQKERAESVDFKIITFSLGGKDYGVDIMNVKEIAKADKFTFVPNAASFVRGVYNLRGDIIPIIDLRTFFHVPLDKKADGQENMLILRINEQVYGTIVDKIDKVVGVNHESIQPPHPIFGDINIKFISGVVEKEGVLYVILDVIRIFGQKKEEGKEHSVVSGGDIFVAPPKPEEQTVQQQAMVSDSALDFIKEALSALKHFIVTPLNDTWLRTRFNEWRAGRTDDDLQLKNAIDAEDFLSNFASPCTGEFWSDEYAAGVKNVLPAISSNTVQAWDIGCGKGYEAFSFACILKSKYPTASIKVWANDNDIMAISQVPSLVFDQPEDIPEYCREFLVKGKTGYTFNQVIKDAVVFEYHDVLNDTSLPDLDIILARDILSYFSEEDQNKMIGEFADKLKDQGVVIVGKNEEIFGGSWMPLTSDTVSVFVNNA